jgi:hypothetical protein
LSDLLANSPIKSKVIQTTVNNSSEGGSQAVSDPDEEKITISYRQEVIYLESKDPFRIQQVKVFNAIGKSVIELNLGEDDKTNVEIQTINLSRGVYFVQIMANNKLFTRKFVKS